MVFFFLSVLKKKTQQTQKQNQKIPRNFIPIWPELFFLWSYTHALAWDLKSNGITFPRDVQNTEVTEWQLGFFKKQNNVFFMYLFFSFPRIHIYFNMWFCSEPDTPVKLMSLCWKHQNKSNKKNEARVTWLPTYSAVCLWIHWCFISFYLMCNFYILDNTTKMVIYFVCVFLIYAPDFFFLTGECDLHFWTCDDWKMPQH